MIPTLGICMSLNDPQWGNRGNKNGGDKPNDSGPRRPNQGPPDLEDLWRDFNRKLNGMFGKKGGGGNGGGGDGPRMPQIDFNPKFLAAASACCWPGGCRLAGFRLLYCRCLAARPCAAVR
jgi:membrane protease subunit HflK